MKLTINSIDSLSLAIGKLRELFSEIHYFQITINTGKSRSLSQNAISHAWYVQVAREELEYDAETVKCLCKLHYGLPIVRGDDEMYNGVCVQVIDPLPYENKVKAMKYFPCTSLMKTLQMAEYLEHVQKHYAGRVDLKFPEDK